MNAPEKPATPQAAFERAVADGKIKRFDYDGVALERCDDDTPAIPRGTVRAAPGILFGYPRIGRILVLRRGLAEQLDGPCHVEEKINGYNVRIARIGERLLAFTRGGFVCPFATDRLPDFIDPRFFDDHPDKVLCAEVAGPGNPWLDAVPPFITEDVRFFVFDVGHWNRSDFLPVAEKQRLLGEYGLPGVPYFGHFELTDYEALAQLVLELNEEGREGLIFRQEHPRPRRVKYVTARANLDDLRRSAARMPDMPPGYFAGRLLRVALFLREHGLPAAALEQELGNALLGSLDHSLDELIANRHVAHPFACRFRERHNAERLIEHLRRISGHTVKIVMQDLKRQPDGYWLLRFERRFPMTNSLLHQLLGGGLIYD